MDKLEDSIFVAEELDYFLREGIYNIIKINGLSEDREAIRANLKGPQLINEEFTAWLLTGGITQVELDRRGFDILKVEVKKAEDFFGYTTFLLFERRKQ